MKYKAHDYQAYATNFILEHPISAVFLDMGLGKSVITLSAIFDLVSTAFWSARCWSSLRCVLPEIHGLRRSTSGIICMG